MCSAEEAYGAGDNPLAGMDSFGMDAQEAERQRAIWEAELATLDEEISTLRAVLASKVSKLIQNFEIGKQNENRAAKKQFQIVAKLHY